MVRLRCPACPQNHLRLADAHRLIHGRKNHKDIFCHALRKSMWKYNVFMQKRE